MAMTEEQRLKDEAEFASAYGEEVTKKEQSEDEAFGIDPEAAAEKVEPEAVVVVEDGKGAAEAEAEAAADITAEAENDNNNAAAQDTGKSEPIDTAAAPAESAAVDAEKEAQRLRSWEGRLKARARELGMSLDDEGEAGGAAAAQSEAIEKVAEAAEMAGDTEKAEKADQVAEAVEDGSMSFEQAITELKENFGDEFVEMIKAVAAKAAADAAAKTAEGRLGEIGKTVEDIIAHIGDRQAREHFEVIADAHPDFNEVKDQPEFKEFLKSYPDGEKIAAEGSARQVVKLLSKFKEGAQANAQPSANKPAEAPVDTAAMDAAEGVRSAGGLRLPDEPVDSSDYTKAWEQA